MRPIHLECKPDEMLVKTLGVPVRLVNHHNDKGRVCNALGKHPLVTGMIDEDPASSQPTYLKRLIAIDELSKHGLRVLRDEQQQNQIILICPRLEEWIIDVSLRHGTRVGDFGLPDKANRLHDLMTARLPAFKKLIEHLVQTNCEPILHLQRLLNS